MKRAGTPADRPHVADLLPHPSLVDAVVADLRFEHRARAEGRPLDSRIALVVEFLRILVSSDAFGALVCYRIKASAQRAHIPFLPRLAHRLAMMWAQLSIGDPVCVQPGVRFPHGQVVIDGFVEIASGVEIRPFVTIGLKEGDYRGPRIGANARIGTGAKIIGPVTIGEGAVVGANAVVVDDVAPGAVVAGVPAEPIRRASSGETAS